MSFVERILDIPPDIADPWAYWFILLVSLCEPIPLVGSFVPGQILIMLAGVMVKRGVLDFGDVVAFATVGAVLGDLANYGAGKKYGESFLAKHGRFFFLKPDRLEKIRRVLLRYTGRTLILGRFSSVTRWAAPFLAGSMGISFVKFMVCNIVGGFGFSLALVAFGWFFGEGVEIASRHLGRYLLAAIFLSALIVLMVKWKSKGKPVFHPDHRYVLIMNILSLTLLARIIEDVLTGQSVARLDLEIRGRLMEYWNPAMDAFMRYAYAACAPLHLGLAAAAVCVWLLARKEMVPGLVRGHGHGLRNGHRLRNGDAHPPGRAGSRPDRRIRIRIPFPARRGGFAFLQPDHLSDKGAYPEPLAAFALCRGEHAFDGHGRGQRDLAQRPQEQRRDRGPGPGAVLADPADPHL